MRYVAWLAALLALLASPAFAQEPADWSPPEREIMVPVEGGEIWVRVDGDLDNGKAPVVFIHGGPGGTHMVFGNLISMADERAVIMYDQLDSGMSERPEDPANWRMERFVSELEAIRIALGIDRWHLVGHSWGSALALNYSAHHPDHVASTVLAGTFISTPHWITGTNLLIRELPDAVAADLIACESEDRPAEDACQAASDAFYAAYNGRPDMPERSAAEQAYRSEYSGKGWNPTVYNAMWGPSEFSATGTLLTFNDTPLLSQIDGSRTLFMIGQYDESRIDDVQEFVALTPGAELAVVPGGSHSFPRERPIETEAMLRAWMARHEAAGETEATAP